MRLAAFLMRSMRAVPRHRVVPLYRKVIGENCIAAQVVAERDGEKHKNEGTRKCGELAEVLPRVPSFLRGPYEAPYSKGP